MAIDWYAPLALRNGTRVTGPRNFTTPRGIKATEVTDASRKFSYIVATDDGRQNDGVDSEFDVVNFYDHVPGLPEEPGPKPCPDVDVPPQARGDQPASSMTIRERLAADFVAGILANVPLSVSVNGLETEWSGAIALAAVVHSHSLLEEIKKDIERDKDLLEHDRT